MGNDFGFTWALESLWGALYSLSNHQTKRFLQLSTRDCQTHNKSWTAEVKYWNGIEAKKKINKITLKEIAKKSQQAISPLHFHTHPSHSIPQASLRDQSCVFIFYLFFLKKPGHRLLWEQVTCVLNRADAQQCLYTWQPWTAVSNSCYFDGHVMALRHNGSWWGVVESWKTAITVSLHCNISICCFTFFFFVVWSPHETQFASLVKPGDLSETERGEKRKAHSFWGWVLGNNSQAISFLLKYTQNVSQTRCHPIGHVLIWSLRQTYLIRP